MEIIEKNTDDNNRVLMQAVKSKSKVGAQIRNRKLGKSNHLKR
jgi:hypothetical protein